MTADHSSDSGRQRTVAELLEQYGADGGGGGRRRRRSGRGADAEPATRAGELPTPDRSAADSAADSAERTWSSLSAVSAEEQDRPAPDSDDSPWRGYGGAGLSGYGHSDGAGTFDSGDDALSSEWARPGSEWPRSADPLSSSAGIAPAATGPSATGGYPIDSYLADPDARAATPLGDSYLADSYPVDSYSLDSYSSSAPSASPSASPSALTKPPEEPTEQMPKYPERPGLGQRPGPVTGPITDPMPLAPPGAARKSATGAFPAGTGAFPAGGGRTGATRAVGRSGPNTQVTPPIDPFDEDEELDDDFEPAGARPTGARSPRGGAPRGAAAQAGGRAIPDLPAGLDEEDDLDDRSGLKAWAILIGQGLGGAIGGAVLWVGFRYLWLNLPVVALAAAVVATVGLVFVVRTIRGSEDLQTTMLAVLVGLIVTISPAVLLLAVR
jgi:hypothetical protein